LENQGQVSGDQPNRRLFGFFSSKGGVGSSLLAVNTAVELAQKNVGKVLLLDLVLQHGNITDFLDITPKYTITDLIENFDRLDSNLIENSVPKHASGLYVLPCPRQPEDEDFITAGQAAEIFGFLKSTFNYVVADLGHEFTKTAISYMDVSDFIFLVTTPDVPSLCNTRNALTVFNKLSYAQEKTKVILNRWKMKGEVDFSLVQKNFPMEVFFKIPDDVMTCLTAANQGKALSAISKKSEVTKSVAKLTTDILKLTEKGIPHVAQGKA
jgi:pilus assembly protein CpaE